MVKTGFFCCLLSCATLGAQAPEYTYRVVHVYPHDRAAFTEGLEFRAGFLYESTGINGKSWVRKEKLETGEVLQQINVDSQYFGEGITVFDQQIIQLTYRSQTGFVYDQSSFRRLRTFAYPGEGWALANDGSVVYMSDGTPQIRVWDPVSLQEKRRLTVHDGSKPVNYVNELECVRGEIYANVWQTDRIIRISPSDGHVLAWVNLAGLLSAADRLDNTDVLNGIAYDALGDRLFVTGKFWPKLFEIKIVPKSGRQSSAK